MPFATLKPSAPVASNPIATRRRNLVEISARIVSMLPSQTPMEAAAKNAAAPLDDRERSALLNLLGDADPAVFAAVRNRLVSLGPTVCEWLRPHTLSGDAVVRKHVRSIIHHFESRDADHEFLSFCLRHGEDLDLETGAL